MLTDNTMNQPAFRNPSMERTPLVYVVDDDAEARRALVGIVESMCLVAEACETAEDFLQRCPEDAPSCLITDLRMRGMSGLDLLRHLKSIDRVIPTIIITGFAETPVAVDAMLAGAVTFLEKSAPQHKICEAISQAIHQSFQLLAQKRQREQIRRIWGTINAEERQILQLVAQGKLNKEIAFLIGSPIRTIEDRRRRLMSKVGADSIVDLIRFAVRVEELQLDTHSA